MLIIVLASHNCYLVNHIISNDYVIATDNQWSIYFNSNFSSCKPLFATNHLEYNYLSLL